MVQATTAKEPITTGKIFQIRSSDEQPLVWRPDKREVVVETVEPVEAQVYQATQNLHDVTALPRQRMLITWPHGIVDYKVLDWTEDGPDIGSLYGYFFYLFSESHRTHLIVCFAKAPKGRGSGG